MKKVILIQGAFDLINWGHIQSFKRMKEITNHEGYVIVALNTEKLLKEYKNVESTLPFQQKKEIIESIRYVDLVVPADNFSPIDLLKEYRVDIYCISKEWEHTKAKEINNCWTEMISSSILQEEQNGYSYTNQNFQN